MSRTGPRIQGAGHEPEAGPMTGGLFVASSPHTMLHLFHLPDSPRSPTLWLLHQSLCPVCPPPGAANSSSVYKAHFSSREHSTHQQGFL